MRRRIVTGALMVGGVLMAVWAIRTRNLVMVVPALLLVTAGALLFKPTSVS
jgi:hypothetical protein